MIDDLALDGVHTGAANGVHEGPVDELRVLKVDGRLIFRIQLQEQNVISLQVLMLVNRGERGVENRAVVQLHAYVLTAGQEVDAIRNRSSLDQMAKLDHVDPREPKESAPVLQRVQIQSHTSRRRVK